MQKQSLIFRLIYDIIFFSSFLFMPWWLVVCMGGVGMMLFQYYGEAIFAGVALDLIFGVVVLSFFPPIVFTVLFIFLYFFFQWLKNYIRIYD